MTPPPYWLDVTETLASGMRTGIQRVTIELARELLEQNRGRLIRYNFKTRAFVEATNEETASLFRHAPPSPPPRLQAWAAKWRLTGLLGFLKDAWLALTSLRPPGPAFAWQGGTYVTAEVLGNLARHRAVRRLQREIPTVLMLHDLFPLTHPAFSSLRRGAFARHWRLCGGATHLIAVSEHTRREALHYAEADRQTLPSLSVAHPGHSLGAEAEALAAAPAELPASEFFLCVGTLEHRKNQAALLSAFQGYRVAGGRAALVLVGRPGPGSDPLVRAVEAAVNQGVVWHRNADDAVLSGLYQRALALVYPSLAEGFGLPLVEALAQGTPCVTSNRTSTAEVAERCGGTIVVDPEDESALTDALLAFDQPGFRDRLAATIRSDRLPTWKAFADAVFTSPRPLRLLFDVSSLGYAALGPQHRTGLFRVAAAYANELASHPGVQLGLYDSSGNRLWVARWLGGLGWNRQPWVGSSAAALVCLGARALEFAVYRSPLRTATGAFSALRRAAEAFRARVDRHALASWHAYLSPMEAVPESVRRVPGLTTAVLIHDLIPLLLPDYRQDPADPTRWFSALWRSVAPTDLVFTVSEATKQDWLRLRPEFPAQRVTVAPNAIDHTKFHAGIVSSRPPFFLAVSTVEPRKRFDAVLAGYRAYRAQGGRTPLLLVGEDKGSLLKPSEGVTLLGFVDEAELPLLYAGCQAFVSLSEYEGFGLPILEAMACGAPVVVSNRSSHPEVAGEAGIYVEPDVEAVARALARLDDPAVRNDAARRSLAQAQRFRWDLTVTVVVERIAQEHKHQGDAP